MASGACDSVGPLEFTNKPTTEEDEEDDEDIGGADDSPEDLCFLFGCGCSSLMASCMTDDMDGSSVAALGGMMNIFSPLAARNTRFADDPDERADCALSGLVRSARAEASRCGSGLAGDGRAEDEEAK